MLADLMLVTYWFSAVSFFQKAWAAVTLAGPVGNRAPIDVHQQSITKHEGGIEQ